MAKKSEEPKEFVIPESLALCADLLYTTREERLKIDKVVEELKSREAQLREHLINNLPKSDASGVSGAVASATIKQKEEPVVEDWDSLYKYISRHKAWDLLQRRVSGPAVKARWEDKKVVPGVGMIIVPSISLTKVKK